jgi:predicted HTH transcriptional regulator
MRHLFMYFQEIKWQELIRQKRNEQAAKKAEEDEKKRLEIRQRNGRVASRQLGPVTNIEMGDVQQQRILDLMTDTMEFELGIEAEK